MKYTDEQCRQLIQKLRDQGKVMIYMQEMANALEERLEPTYEDALEFLAEWEGGVLDREAEAKIRVAREGLERLVGLLK